MDKTPEEYRKSLIQENDDEIERKASNLRQALKDRPKLVDTIERLPDCLFNDDLIRCHTWCGTDTIAFYYPRGLGVYKKLYIPLRKLGWKRTWFHDFSSSFDMTMVQRQQKLEVRIEFVTGQVGSACVRIPTAFETKEVPVAYEVYCVDTHPEYFEPDENGQMLYIGPNADKVGIK